MTGRTIRQALVVSAFCSIVLPAHAAAPVKLSAGAAEVRDFVAATASIGYAGTAGGGLWKTGDAGASWTKMNLAAKTVWKIAVNPASSGARLYAATDSGLWRSTDFGNTWTRLSQDPARAVAIAGGAAAGGPETLLVGVTGVGILKSTDSGTTLVRQSSGLDSTDVIGLAYYPGSATTAFAVLQCNVEDAPAPLSGNWGGVFRAVNANAATPTWSAFNTGLPTTDSTRPCANAIAANGTAVVVGIKDYSSMQGCTYRITSAGAPSWTISASSNVGGNNCNPNNAPYGVEWLGADLTNANGFFLGSNQFGPWRSTDGGNNFIQIFTGADPDFTTLAYASGAFTATTWVAGIHGLGLFRTTTGGSPWSLPATPIRADRVNDLANHSGGLPNTFWMALKNGGVQRSTDAGSNWTQFNSGLGTVYGNVTNNFVRSVETIAAHPNNGNVVALGMRAFGLYQLTGGTSWAAVAGFTNGVDHKPQGMTITPSGTVYYSLFDSNALTPGGLFRATATGTTIGNLASEGIPFFEANPGLGVAPGSGRLRTMPSDPENHQYLIMFDSLPYRSGNGGGSWARINVVTAANDNGFQRLAFNDISQDPTDLATLVASSTRGIYKSLDFGANWFRVTSSGLTQTGLAAVVYTGNGTLWGGDYGGQLWCSVNDGTTWQAVTGGSFGAAITELKVLNGQVHALTDGAGVWRKDTVCP